VSQPKPAIHSAPKKVLYFSLPYTGAHSLQIRTQTRWPVAMQFAPGFKLRLYIGFRFPSCELWRGSNTASLALLFAFIFQRFKTIPTQSVPHRTVY
jgi:hypothetical protein